VLGYVSVAVALIATLYLQFTANSSNGVEYLYEEGVNHRTPVKVMVVSSVFLSLGWAFLLAGASDCRRRIFLPIILVFALQWILFSPVEGDMILGSGLGFMAIIGIAVAHLASSRATYWRELPVLEFSAWLMLMLASMASLFLLQSRQETALTLDVAFSLPQMLAAPFWIILGIEAIDIGLKLAKPASVRVLRIMPPTRKAVLYLLGYLLLRLVIFAVLAGAFVGFVGNWGFMELFFSLLLLLVTLLLSVPLVLGWLGLRTIAAVFTFSLCTPIVSLATTTALFPEADIVGSTFTALGAGAGVLPAALLFVGLAAYDVMNFGVRYANVDGIMLPRTGRVLMYFGTVLLVAAYVMFYLNTEVVGTGEEPEALKIFIDGMFMIGVWILGVPYLIWNLVKRPERFT
jgi:nitrate reductase NapE component